MTLGEIKRQRWGRWVRTGKWEETILRSDLDSNHDLNRNLSACGKKRGGERGAQGGDASRTYREAQGGTPLEWLSESEWSNKRGKGVRKKALVGSAEKAGECRVGAELPQ